MTSDAYTFAPLTLEQVPQAAKLKVAMWSNFSKKRDDYFYEGQVESLEHGLQYPQYSDVRYTLMKDQDVVCGLIGYRQTESHHLEIHEIDVPKDDTEAQDTLIKKFIDHGAKLGMRKLSFEGKKNSDDETDNDFIRCQHTREILLRNGFRGSNLQAMVSYRYDRV